MNDLPGPGLLKTQAGTYIHEDLVQDRTDQLLSMTKQLTAERDEWREKFVAMTERYERVVTERDALQKRVDEFTIYNDALYEALTEDEENE